MENNEILNTIGKAWKKSDDEIRWYVNDWQEMIELDVRYYNTGNVSHVEWGEEEKSNCWFKRYVQRTKVWMDSDLKVHVDYCDESAVRKAIVNALESRIESLKSADAQVMA